MRAVVPDNTIQNMAPTDEIANQTEKFLCMYGGCASRTPDQWNSEDNELSQAAEPAPRSPRDNHMEDEVGAMPRVSGVRKLLDGRIVLEPKCESALSMIWLLTVRTEMQDDSSILNARGPH